MARNSNNKYPNKRPGQKVSAKFAFGDCKIESFHHLDEAMNQRSRHLAFNEQTMIEGDMRTLMQDLEYGEVHYAVEMAVPSAFKNKQAELVTIIRTFLNGNERLWAVRHSTSKSYVWEVTYNSISGVFGAFHIYSCDNVVLMA